MRSLAPVIVVAAGALFTECPMAHADSSPRRVACGDQTAEPPDWKDPSAERQDGHVEEQDVGGRPIVSLLGEELKPVEIPAERRAKLEQDLAEAKAAYDADPTDEDAIIWHGRRLAYLGRYWDAIDVYTNGLTTHKSSPRLLRHRGHRWITVRELDLAVGDLSRVAMRIRFDGVPDEVEPDGMPNAAGVPTSTLHTNIWYHLGLAQYLQGKFEASCDSYTACLESSKNDDMRVAASYWLYLNRKRLGDDAAAQQVLDGISADMNIIENETYQRLLLLFKGEIKPEEVPGTMESAVGAAVDDATMAYGVAMWHLFSGREDEAQRAFERILENVGGWAAFGYIAAEAELARRKGSD